MLSKYKILFWNLNVLLVTWPKDFMYQTQIFNTHTKLINLKKKMLVLIQIIRDSRV